jgi:CRP-like cAMP-binding protein
MPLIANAAVLKVFATLVTCQAGETLLEAGSTTGRLLILRRGAVTIEGMAIAEVSEPGAIFGELSALLNQPHTADVRALESSEFHVGRAELLEQDPVILSCVHSASILEIKLSLNCGARSSCTA